MNTETTALAGPVTITTEPPVARFNLRVRPDGRGAAGKAFGLEPPEKAGQGAHGDRRSVWCLGPDEWLLHAPEAETEDVAAAFAAIRPETPHSLVDISDRELVYALEGERARELLTIGCPIDLARMEPGTAKRTLFDTAQIVLLRDASDRFRIEVWRSFAPHVEDLLRIGNAELASGF